MVQQPKQEKVWASLITNLSYLPGILTLSHSLQTTETAYPFIALYTSTFPAEGLAALHARGIRTQAVPSVQPGQSRVFLQDPRFNETWNKLIVFSLVEYDRIVLLDGDMLVRKNMDELMDVPLDGPGSGLSSEENKQERVFAASHVCACNPLNKPHYPKTWYVHPIVSPSLSPVSRPLSSAFLVSQFQTLGSHHIDTDAMYA